MAYRAAASCQPTKTKDYLEPLEAALGRCEDLIQRIIYATGCTEYRVFIGGNDNFRYTINPEYKANRRDVARPTWLQPVREYLVTNHKTTITDGIEADDALGIAQDKKGLSTTIASIDKDLLMIAGKHYNFVKDEHQIIEPVNGLRWFYQQLIMGDRADNIYGYDGKCRDKVPQFLEPTIAQLHSYDNEIDMYSLVSDMYGDDERLHMNAHCLYIHQKENDEWQRPK